MRKARSFILCIIVLVATIRPTFGFTQSSVLIWRSYVDNLPVPPPPASGTDNGCHPSPGEECSPALPSGLFKLHPQDIITGQSDPSCSQGKIRIYANWLGQADNLQVRIHNTDGSLEHYDSITNRDAFPIETTLKGAGNVTFEIQNFGNNDVIISKYGHQIGCQVQATFDNIWVDYDVFQDNAKGMLVHSHFDISNQKDANTFTHFHSI